MPSSTAILMKRYGMPQSADIAAKPAQARALVISRTRGSSQARAKSASRPATATKPAATAVSANRRSKSPAAMPRRIPVNMPGC